MNRAPLFYLMALGMFSLALVGCEKNHVQPEIQSRNAAILKDGSYEFKDLNKNGRIDVYEDWRRPVTERVEDLLSQMTLEEKAGFMIISQINMGTGADGRTPDGSLNEKDVITTTNMFTGIKSDTAINVSATTKGILERHLRHFILRANAPARVMAQWSNNVQAVAEQSRLGIPAIYASNPRNHIATDNSAGLNVGNTSFTQWPGTLGLAAADDLGLVRSFAESASSEWAAVGIRKGYMYQLDLATEPRWSRIEGTFGEDADKVADIAREIVLGFQKESLGTESVVLTMKHFPGAGTEYKGWDAHYDYGKNLVYPGGMMDYHLKPFRAAVEAGTSGIMPYYAQPKGTDYEEVGFVYNRGVLSSLLREGMGFDGIINSDTGPINNMPWGVEGLSIHERYQKALEAGCDLFSGAVDTENLLKAVRDGLVSENRLDESVRRLLREKFLLGLFENPYVDEEYADAVVNSEEYRALAAQAFRKSIVLMRNDAGLLPLKQGAKVFMERLQQPGRNGGTGHEILSVQGKGVTFTQSASEADVAVLWVSPGASSMFSAGGRGPQEVSNLLSQNGVDVEYVNSISSKMPTVILVNFSRPWVISEIENGKDQTLLATFGTTMDAVLDVILGEFAPTGKLPFAIPSSQEAVENNKEDVPGNMEPEGYALFKAGHGISYLAR